MKLIQTTLVTACVALTSVDLLAADGPVAEPGPAAAVTEPAPAAPPAAISGRILYRGPAPAFETVDLASDPVCEGMHEGGWDRSFVKVKDGGLADVFIQLTDGVPDERFKSDDPVVLDQVGCSYEPHVFGVLKKQPIEIVNSDETLHNIHAVPKKNKEFNVGMPNKGMRIEKEFKKEEDAIRIKCDVHPWMVAYCFTLEHPFYAVTDAEGKFSLPTEGLTDGEYGVKLWHEVLGEREGTVTVEGGAASFEMTFETE